MKRTRDPHVNDSSSSEPGRFHRRELRLKVSTSEEGSEADNDSRQPPQQQRKHFCVICSKQFSSGKAYGGHVRIHSSEYSNKGNMKKMKMKKKSGLVKEKGKEKEKEIDLIRADVEGKIRCCLCGKVFQTMNSLFGHMRRHPDRTWKGIRPPPPPPPEKFKLSYLSDDDGDDVMSRSTMMSDVTEDVQKAACVLMMLSYTSSNDCGGMKKAMESPKSEVRSSSCNNKDDDKENLVVDMKKKMEIEMNVNKPQDDAERSSGFDLNQPCHNDHPYSCCN